MFDKGQSIYLFFFVFQALEAKYEAEIEKLKSKLKWYAQNQEFLDKGAKQLKNKEDEVHKLKLRIEELQTEVIDIFCQSSTVSKPLW